MCICFKSNNNNNNNNIFFFFFLFVCVCLAEHIVQNGAVGSFMELFTHSTGQKNFEKSLIFKYSQFSAIFVMFLFNVATTGSKVAPGTPNMFLKYLVNVNGVGMDVFFFFFFFCFFCLYIFFFFLFTHLFFILFLTEILSSFIASPYFRSTKETPTFVPLAQQQRFMMIRALCFFYKVWEKIFFFFFIILPSVNIL
jgi:hypothetical protein